MHHTHQSQSTPITQDGAVPHTVAFIASGKLYLCSHDTKPVEFESPFLTKIEENKAQRAQSTSWMESSNSWNLSCGAQSVIPGAGGCEASSRPSQIATLTRTPDGFGYLAYAQTVCAMLSLDANDLSENRLKHSTDPIARTIAMSPDGQSNAMSIANEDGTAHIAIARGGFSNPQCITFGDVIDDAPSFNPIQPSKLLYHSAGIGRNANGEPFGLGPSSIHEVDLDLDQVTTRIEHDSFDYLSPKVSLDGDLYCLRRPWQLSRPQSTISSVKDMILMPIRLGGLLLYLAHSLSKMLTNKPILPKFDQQRMAQPSSSMHIWNQWVSQERSKKKQDKHNSMVPKDWTLIRISRSDGEQSEMTIADHVAAFDIASDGSVIYTNGSKIWKIHPDNRTSLIASGSLIHAICAR